jgi:CheY-like chemotaxis protein
VVEDQQLLRELLVRALLREGYEAEGAADAGEALRKLTRRAFDVVVTDWVLPDAAGPGLIRSLRAGRPRGRLVVVSGYAGSLDMDELEALGVDAVLAKPAEIREILEAVGQLVPAGGREEG